MTRDPLDLLRAADPVPHRVAYSESDQTSRIADILDRDGRRPLPLAGDTPERRSGAGNPRWLVIGVAAVVVLLLAVGLAVLAGRRSSNDEAAGDRPVTCAVAADGGRATVSNRLTRAQVAIEQRVRDLGGSARSFAATPAEAAIGFTPHGISIAVAAKACRTSTFSIRPVIVRSTPVDTRVRRSSAPLSALGFAVPSSEAAYSRLTAAQRTRLTGAMSHYDCSPLSATTAVGLTCASSGGQQVFLAGPPLVRGPDLRDAVAQPPATGSGVGSAQWTLALSFRAAAAGRLRSFTAAHHTGDTTATLTTCGAASAVPCADFLAFMINGRAELVPVTNAVLGSEVSISGGFSRATTLTLAADLIAASTQLRPR